MQNLLESVLAAGAHNSKRGVTGGLMFNREYFGQVLEGPRAVVSELFCKIAQDPRHRSLVIAEASAAERRLTEIGACSFNPSVALCLACGRIASDKDRLKIGFCMIRYYGMMMQKSQTRFNGRNQMRPKAYLRTFTVALPWLLLLPGQVFAGLTLRHSHAAYPVSGAFAYVDKTDPAMAGQACKVFAKFGLQKLTGNTVGELIVFDGKRRLDFGGYADTESQNIYVRQTTEREFDIVDQSYDDGEGGGRPGQKKKRYTLKVLGSTKLEITDRYGTASYVRCEEPQAERKAKADLPQQLNECKDTTITQITDRFEKPLSFSPPKDGFDPGTRVRFGNGGEQVSYDKESAIARSKIGDKVRMCLKQIPKNCPAGDNRGRIYNTTNLRTGEAWTLSDSQHSCGGA